MSNERTPLVASPKCPHGDPEAQRGREEDPSSKVDWVFLVIAQTGVFLAQADDSFVLSTHSEIASHFQRLSLGPWLVTAYNLGCCVALPMYGRLSYIYGYKVMLLAAYSLFAFGCAITGSSVSIWMAVAGRAIAGVGGSGMMDLISVMLTDMAPLKDVALLRSYIVIAANVGVSVGAPLGGVLADVIGWRWSFLGQAPMAGLCFTMAVWRLPSISRHQQVGKSGTNLTQRNPELDFFGICFLGITIAATMGLGHLFGEGEFGKDQITAVLLAIALVTGILFGLNEAFWTRDPLMPFWLLKTKGIGIVYIGQVLVEFSLFSLISNISEYFIRTENVTNSVAGSYLLFVCLGGLIGSLLYGKRIQQTGRYKTLALVGSAIAVMGNLAITLRWSYGASLWELMYPFCAAIGIGGLLSAQFLGLSASTPKEMSASVITMYYLSQQLGMILGTTLSAAISRRVFGDLLLRRLATYPEAFTIQQLVLKDNRFAFSLPEPIQEIIRSSFLHSFRVIPLMSVISMALLIPLLYYLPEWPLE